MAASCIFMASGNLLPDVFCIKWIFGKGERYMFCKFCGKETTGKFLYCPFCGKNQNEEVYEDAKSSRQEQGQNDGFNRVNENSNQCKNTGE